jgi:hypothetical protein
MGGAAGDDWRRAGCSVHPKTLTVKKCTKIEEEVREVQREMIGGGQGVRFTRRL